MLAKLIKKNILRNRMGSFLIIFPIALVVMLFISTSSIMNGVSDKIYERYEGAVVRTLLPVFIDKTSDKTFYNSIARTEGVYLANPAMFVEEDFNGNKVFVKHVSIDIFNSFNKIFSIPAVNCSDGRMFNSSREVIAEYNFAKSNNLKVNDSVIIGNKNFSVSCLYDPWRGVNPAFIIPDLGGEYNLVEAVVNYQKYESIEQKITSYESSAKIVEGGAVSSYFKESALLLEKSLTQILIVIVFIVLLSLINLMNLSVYERRHEIGLLLNIGMKQNLIWTMIVLESGALALIGFAAGIILGFFVSHGLMALFGFLTRSQIIWPLLSSSSIINAFIISVLVGFFSSLYAAFRGSRFDFNNKGRFV
jgi:hypothetical protein